MTAVTGVKRRLACRFPGALNTVCLPDVLDAELATTKGPRVYVG
jgi:hypothetical protein